MKKLLVVFLAILAIIVVSFIVSAVNSKRVNAPASSDINPFQEFRGPTDSPNVKGPSGPPPQQ